jgi:hypothetical protein
MDDYESLNRTKWDRKYHVVLMLQERTRLRHANVARAARPAP